MEAFETSGYTLKEEQVTALTQGILKGTFVLENSQPFPGYYGLLMKEPNVPRSIFFICTEKHSWESILRATEKVNKKYGSRLNGAAAEVQLGRQTYYGIRVNGIASYDEVEKYQTAYRDLGYTMEKSHKFRENDPALIKVKKFFHIHESEDGIYSDDSDPNMSYILIDSQLDWNDFRKVTEFVKNNITDKNYDIVSGVFYMNGGVQDMLRVLKPDASAELLREIQTKYKKEHAKYA